MLNKESTSNLCEYLTSKFGTVIMVEKSERYTNSGLCIAASLLRNAWV